MNVFSQKKIIIHSPIYKARSKDFFFLHSMPQLAKKKLQSDERDQAFNEFAKNVPFFRKEKKNNYFWGKEIKIGIVSFFNIVTPAKLSSYANW